jgi:hypothetical protein
VAQVQLPQVFAFVQCVVYRVDLVALEYQYFEVHAGVQVLYRSLRFKTAEKLDDVSSRPEPKVSRTNVQVGQVEVVEARECRRFGHFFQQLDQRSKWD